MCQIGFLAINKSQKAQNNYRLTPSDHTMLKMSNYRPSTLPIYVANIYNPS